MYNKSLDAFKAVADYGSFSKAASHLYITHTALIKQINSLESRLNVKLFYRTHHGVSLTSSGIVLYAKLDDIFKLSDQTIAEVKNSYSSTQKILLMGTSTLYPCYIFMNIWDKISKNHPEFVLKMVSFQNDANRLNLLNHVFDFMVGPFNTTTRNSSYLFIPLGTYRFCLSVNRNHPLAKYNLLSFKDLSHYNIRIMKPGHSLINDQIRTYINKNHPKINILDIAPSYDISTFNSCANSQDILLSLECWKNIHPSLKSISLKEDFQLPYGIITSKNMNYIMQKFITVVKNTL